VDDGQRRDRQVLLFQVFGRFQFGHEHQHPVAQAGERVPRVHRQGRDQRQQVALEVVPGEIPLHFVQVLGLHDEDTLSVQLGFDGLVEHMVLAQGQLMDPPGQDAHHLARGPAVGARLDDPGIDLPPDARHPHHEKLVPVVGDDGHELHPLQQRDHGILGLLQHPLVEVQPAQFAVQVIFRLGERSAHTCHYAPSPLPGPGYAV
jgi:hypothetical protein